MESPRYIIRDAVEDDVEQVLAMHAQSWLETYQNDEIGASHEWAKAQVAARLSDENKELERQRVRNAARDKDFLYRVAENEKGEIVAVIKPFRNDDVQRVGAIYVAKEHHGKGIAQKLMDEIIAWADQSRPLQLNVATYNERAKAFYRKYGFKEVDGSEHKIYDDTVPVITMIRKGDKQ